MNLVVILFEKTHRVRVSYIRLRVLTCGLQPDIDNSPLYIMIHVCFTIIQDK